MTRAHALALLLPTALAVAVLLPHVAHVDWLSDDYLLTNLLEGDGTGADWGEIGRQFGSRWMYSQAYWRPIVNVVYGLNVDLLGFTPLALGIVNLALHLVVVAATAHLCFVLMRPPGATSDRARVFGALAGGAFAALHPAAIETVLWISARVSGLEVAFRMLALVTFLAHLRSGRRRWYLATAMLSALALGSKESAVVLPVALLAVDLLEAPRRPLRARLRLHLPLFALWVGYAVVRVIVLGGVVGSPTPEPSVGQALDLVAAKLGALLAPIGPPSTVVLWVPLVVLALVLHPGHRRALLWTSLVLVGWLAACLAPTYKVPLGAGWIGVRMLYDALPVVGLGIAYALGAAATRFERLAAAAVGIGIGVAAWSAGAGYAADFETAWRRNADARAELQAAATTATVERPVGILSLPPCRRVPGPPNPAAYFVVGERPFTDRPYPALGLGAVLDRFPHSAEVFQDPRPVHALLAAGTTVARWDETAARIELWTRAVREPFVASGPDVALPPELTAPLAFEAIEVRTTPEVAGGSVVWRTELGEFGGPAALRFGGGTVDAGARSFFVDVTRHAPLLALALADRPLTGLRIEVDGGRVEQVVVRPRLPRIELDRRLDGRELALADVPALLRAPADDTDLPMRCVIAGAAATYAFAVTPGAPVELPQSVRFHVDMFENALRARRHWYWFETTAPQGQPGSARSAVDHFVVHDASGTF